MSALPPIIVSAVAVVRERRVLMVTARGRDVLYLPGGKVDEGESAVDAAARETREELGADALGLKPLFTVRTQAHGEPEGRDVHMSVFAAQLDREARPSGEIDSLHWVDASATDRCPPAGVETLRRLRALGLVD
ncbi:NTP pyrophosphohydrolase [Rathayibacter rathayi]|uniref:NTP pyrophosphohydrolase n=1 Tax=Rathayibacter rathayi TaxID=33887 RepID=A0ABX5ACC3_RATRA|nr:NUDIX domain-containing protein [Rathayibacter rathayi]PPF79373.1 NTP pyrophosphohydrolase [Rathayibacter rathayi]PPH35946.1 NTP pyrophosphohydrolase [Rathayibacter rathayi]PPH75816.1 NTP pyrophosphohydrolase [Rathayibacter rathayi]PPI65362.1 NTP pyrophosphohydrolase [Rathayibacter rathayi]